MEGIWLISYIVLWLLVLTLGVLVFLLYRQLGIMYLGTAEGVSRDGLAKGARAPDFTLVDQYGESHTLSSYRGKPAILIFGSATCSPCRILMPQLQAWTRDHPDIPVLWLNAASPEESLRFVSDTGATVPVMPYTPESKIMDKYKVRVTPFCFVLNSDGIVGAKGLVNTRSGLDLYLKEMRTGKIPSLDDEQEPEQAIVVGNG